MQINLLPYESPFIRYRTVGLIGLTATLFLVNLLFAANWFYYASEQKQAQQMIDTATAELAKIQVKAGQNQKTEQLMLQAQVFEKWSGKRPPLINELNMLSTPLPGSSYFSFVQYTETAGYQMQTELPDLDSTAVYLKQIQNNQYFKSVTVRQVTRSQNNKPKLDFQVFVNRQ
jgi:hypothetical protein